MLNSIIEEFFLHLPKHLFKNEWKGELQKCFKNLCLKYFICILAHLLYNKVFNAAAVYLAIAENSILLSGWN